MKRPTAIIIGSGVAGLASAVRLRYRGFRVQLFESNPYPGGKLTEISQDGFRWDAGPSVFTLPNQLLDVLKLAGTEKSFRYKELEESCRFFWEDGSKFKAFADKDKLALEIRSVFGVSPQPYLDILKKSEYIYGKTKGVFLERSLHKAQTYFSKDFLPGLLAIPKLQIFDTMHNHHRKNLNHEKLIQIFDRYATYNGSSPYKASGILDIIPHTEQPVGFPLEGMHAITRSLVEAGKKLGVKYQFSSKVAKINIKNNRINGVTERDGTCYNSDIVICNSDVASAYRYLLPKTQKASKYELQERSASGIVFYWGINGQFPQLDLHNAFFSNDYKDEFDCLFDKKTISNDPTIYLNITSKHKKDDAPSGCENWFVMVNAPSNSGQDWETIETRVRKVILEKLKRVLNRDIEPLIISENTLNPIKLEQKTSSHMGSLYGTSSNSYSSAFMRHPNYSSRFRGLYFCGGSVHPGGGVPISLLSAKITSEIAAKDFSHSL